MNIDSIVETLADFEELRRLWKLPYPKKGQVLTVSGIMPHPNPTSRKKGIVLLHFKELPNLTGICDKDIHGNLNFVELKLPDDIYEWINEPVKQAINDIHPISLELSDIMKTYIKHIEEINNNFEKELHKTFMVPKLYHQ